MANGSAATALLPPGCRSKDAPESSASTELGLAVADATAVLCRAMFDYRQNGELDPMVKKTGGDRIAKVATWQLDHGLGDSEFAAMARQQGKIALRRYFPVDFYRNNSPTEVEAACDLYINELLEVVAPVVAAERSFRAARAN